MRALGSFAFWSFESVAIDACTSMSRKPFVLVFLTVAVSLAVSQTAPRDNALKHPIFERW